MSRLNFSSILLIILTTVSPVVAQQANQNINVLPVIPQQNELDNEWFKLGDGFLQRQVEPTIAVSTRNPDHLLSFFNDYRAVDVPDDVGIGEEIQVASLTLKTMDLMFAGLLPQHGVPYVAPPPVAAAEAWVGGSRSYDGGLTWSGFFMPGAPFDLSPASLGSPIHGLEAATDPVAVAGPCGYVYVVFVAFTRGDQSKMVVARYQDLNNAEGGDTWEYQGMTVLETGNNATNGYFLDKPNIALDVWRGPGAANQCSHRVYASYSTFNGLDKDGKFQSKLNFAVSENLGATFATQKINKTWNQNQGSVIAVDPRPGTPSNQGGPGTIYVFWRHFFDPDTILMARSTAFGARWDNPTAIIGTTPMATFDQPTISTSMTLDPDSDVAFRSNGFPTAVVTPEGPDGTLFVAWQERVDGSGQPDAIGSPRIVMMRSTNGGGSWTDINGNPGARVAVDFGDRDSDPGTLPPAGFGALPDDRASGPQVMPWLSFGGGRLALVYYESRGLLGGGDIGIQDLDLSPTTNFISGIDRVVDFRAALLDPATGQLEGTTQISRYPIGAGADLSDGEQVEDIAPVTPGYCSPDFGPGYQPCDRQLNLMNKPQSGSGGSPFMGDYTGATPTVQFVFDDLTQRWRWATEPEDVPYRGFHTIFADNRHLVPPTYPASYPEWKRYQFYGPPEIGGACTNVGSRNTDVLTARLDAELIVSAPTTYKQLNARRGFPIRVQNGTGGDRFYRLTITLGAGAASFSANPDSDIDTGDVQVYPYSSVSQTVYVEAGAAGPIRVDVVEITGLNGSVINGGQTGTVTFNPDPSNDPVTGLGATETQDPFVLNPFVLNPFVLNPFVLNSGETNLSVSNPFVLNPFVLNPFVLNSTVYDVVDTTWEVGTEGGTNTSSSYVPVINIDNAEQFVGNYAFQLIVYKTSTFAGYDDACQAYNISQDQILSNVVQDPDDPQNPFVLNPFVLNPFVLNEGAENPFVLNPFVLNPFVLNSAFTMAPPDANTAKRASSKALGVADDGTLRAPRAPESIKITLRAYQLKPLCAEGETPGPDCISFVYDPRADAASAAVGSLTCIQEKLAQNDSTGAAACFDSYAPDLIPLGVSTDPLEVDAGDSVTFPVGGWTLKNQGTAAATAENRDLRHGFYLSPDENVDFDASGNPINGDYLLTSVSSGGPGTTIAAGAEESFAASSLPVPLDVPEGAYNLILYVDDLEEVSELDEINNKVLVRVPIYVAAPNEPPVADPALFDVTEDTAFSGVLTASDINLGDTLTFSIATQPANGSLTLDDASTGAFTYTPNAGFNGSDSFTFQANDGELDSAPATVSLAVSAVNDAPSFTKGADQAVDEDSGAQSVAGWATGISTGPADESGQTVSFNLSNDNPGLFLVQPAISPVGTLTYTPAADANGSATVTVTLSDNGGIENGGVDTSAPQTFVITVNAVNDPPVVQPLALTINEDGSAVGTLTVTDPDSTTFTYAVNSLPSNGTAAFSASIPGQFTYTPNENFNGGDTFTVTVTDTSGGGGSASVTITITAVNDPPVALPDSLTVNQNSGATPIDLLSNDFDVDGNPVSLSSVTQPAHGTVALAGGGVVTYMPALNYVGADSFSYVIGDGTGLTASATVSVTVVDPVPDWNFVGLLTPYKPNYKVNLGSAIPLKWYYTAPGSNTAINSSGAQPRIRIKGPFVCSQGENASTVEVVNDSGSSDLRYSGDSWQFNWDTAGLTAGCYNVRIVSQYTSQVNGPFRIELR